MGRQKDLSQMDPGGVLKSAHDFGADSLKTINGIGSVPGDYSRVDITYNAAGSVTNTQFFKGITSQKTEVRTTADIAGSLNSRYFQVYSENDDSLYHIWYNVGGLGVDPAPVGSVGIEVGISTNDSATIIGLATKLNMSYLEDFIVTVVNNKVCIETKELGVASLSSDIDTGFGITTTQLGTRELIKSIDVPFSDGVRYVFNEEERRFEIQGGVNSDGSINVNIVNTPSFNENTVITFNEITAVGSSTLTTLVTYTVPVGKTAYLQRVESGGENIAVYQVEINTVEQAKRRTYWGDSLTTDFVFAESTENGVELAAGDVVRVRVEHFRPMSGDFEGRIQVLEIG